MSVDTANFSCLSDKVSAQPQVVKKGLLPDTMESPMAQTDAQVGAVLVMSCGHACDQWLACSSIVPLDWEPDCLQSDWGA